jgi:hypothetical protein
MICGTRRSGRSDEASTKQREALLILRMSGVVREQWRCRLAQALWGTRAEESVPYRRGGVTRVRVVNVMTAARVQEENVAAKRQAVIQQAVAESERISDRVFALAVGSKWGDYDPGEAPA